jgi:hypothetical protein
MRHLRTLADKFESMRALRTLADKFEKAPQVLVTHLEKYRAHHGWLAAKSYPGAFVADRDEAGMVIENGEIVYRVFHVE